MYVTSDLTILLLGVYLTEMFPETCKDLQYLQIVSIVK